MKITKKLSITLRFLSQDKSLTGTQVRFMVSWLTDAPHYHRTLKEFERELKISSGSIHARVINELVKKDYLEKIGTFKKDKLKAYHPLMKASPVFGLGKTLKNSVLQFEEELFKSRETLIQYDEKPLQDGEDFNQDDRNITNKTKDNQDNNFDYLSLVKSMASIREGDKNALEPEYELNRAMCIAKES
jgi:hypothetical protein